MTSYSLIIAFSVTEACTQVLCVAQEVYLWFDLCGQWMTSVKWGKTHNMLLLIGLHVLGTGSYMQLKQQTSSG